MIPLAQLLHLRPRHILRHLPVLLRPVAHQLPAVRVVRHLVVRVGFARKEVLNRQDFVK